ncbi:MULTISPECIES: hypothetical protein [unclassified Oceanispirochaeta]|uniref:hypothetical protein n=1 Tax=unclassified Oceanispirochaeta TaxID=2635722 RepID=UPI0013148978|nr:MULTISPECIES: hypothetical protein [unclassified Oceanispirochaeta]MBF9015123.1 hypothetical protein [Oceanispirochaeta sp. M2]NPD71581.1 hypothetical protein [Oceanispirochaeta sp. M1]
MECWKARPHTQQEAEAQYTEKTTLWDLKYFGFMQNKASWIEEVAVNTSRASRENCASY